MKEKNMTAIKKYKESPNNLTKEQKDKLIEDYAPLIKFIAKKIALRLPSSIELDDLISSGVMGLMDALEKYDMSRENTFKTYAEFRIRGSILDELRSQDWAPRSIRDKAKIMERAQTQLESKLGRKPTSYEVAKKLKISRTKFHKLENDVRPVSMLSIDEQSSFNNFDKKSILSIIYGSNIGNPSVSLDIKDLKYKIATCIKQLPEKQRVVMNLYYYEDLNLKEIGDMLKVTESRISQLRAQALLKLKERLLPYINNKNQKSELAKAS